MEILSSEIINISGAPGDLFNILWFMFSGIFLMLGVYWLYDILANKEKFSIGSIVFIIIGVLSAIPFVQQVILYEESYEEVKAIVTDWNIVHEEGWEIVNQEGKLVTLKRGIEEDE